MGFTFNIHNVKQSFIESITCAILVLYILNNLSIASAKLIGNESTAVCILLKNR